MPSEDAFITQDFCMHRNVYTLFPPPPTFFYTKRPRVVCSAPVESCLFLVLCSIDFYCFRGLITVKEEKRSISMLDFLKRQLMISNGKCNEDRDLASAHLFLSDLEQVT